MALSKTAAKLHRQACELVGLPRDLDVEERMFVLDNFQESQTATHNLDGAFFSPFGIARDIAIHTSGGRIVDLCAGIGRLGFHVDTWGGPARELTCVERNAEYARVGRKILPEARWIIGDVFDLPADLGGYDWAISNPPFGATARRRRGGAYSGGRFEYHVIDIASTLAEQGTFLIPQESAPFVCSGRSQTVWRPTREHDRFARETRIELECVSVNTADYADDWHGVSPLVEIVTSDFENVRAAQPALW